jgi:hypothetical protein
LRLSGFFGFPGPQARRADVKSARTRCGQNLHPLEIRGKKAVRFSVRVTHGFSGAHSLFTDGASIGHTNLLGRHPGAPTLK